MNISKLIPSSLFDEQHILIPIQEIDLNDLVDVAKRNIRHHFIRALYFVQIPGHVESVVSVHMVHYVICIMRAFIGIIDYFSLLRLLQILELS